MQLGDPSLGWKLTAGGDMALSPLGHGPVTAPAAPRRPRPA